METGQIRAHLHKYIDKATDSQIAAIYIILEDKVEAVQDRVSVAEYNQEIDKSEQEYEAGKSVTHDEFLKEIKQW